MTLACPVCGRDTNDVPALADHLVGEAGKSDVRHVMWLNRNVTKHRVDAGTLAPQLQAYLAGDDPAGDRVAR